MQGRHLYPDLFKEDCNLRDVCEYLQEVSKEIFPTERRTLNNGSFNDVVTGRRISEKNTAKRMRVIAYVREGNSKLTFTDFLNQKRNDSNRRKNSGYRAREEKRRAAQAIG